MKTIKRLVLVIALSLLAGKVLFSDFTFTKTQSYSDTASIAVIE